MHNPAPQSPSAAPPSAADRERTSHIDDLRAAPVVTSHHVVALYPEVESMLRAVARDIREARERVWVETYIFRHDRLARAAGESLARAAARGVDVRLLYDPLGCNETDPAIFDRLRARGIDVRAYRPRRVQWREERWWPRDHSRIVVIDGAGYTGGAAWGDEWLPRRYGGQGWHDVCTRVQGPCTQDFARAFAQRWAEAAGAHAPPVDYTTGGKYPDLELVADSPYGRPEVLRRHRDAIRRARKRVWIENAYFLPTRGLLRDLYAAAARGVDVRLILPGETDLPILKRAARARFADWLAHGLKVYEYGPRMVHSKFALVDDDWTTVGTFNINVISVRYANEVNLFVYDRGYVAQVAALFEHDLARCEPVTPDAAARRSLGERVQDATAHLLFGLLEVGRGRA